MKRISILLFAAIACVPTWGQNSAKTPEVELTELRFMAKPLPIDPPANGRSKTEQENKQDLQRQAAAYAVAAAKAKEFYTKYPSHANANEAKKIECVALLRAVQAGLVEEEPRATRLASEFRSDAKQASAARYEVATLMTQDTIRKKNIKDTAALMAEHEQQALNLLGEFPDEPAVYEYFLGVARNSDPVRARAMTQRVLLMPAPASVKEQARTVVDRLNLPGSSPNLEWQDESGTAHRIADYKGKVVVFYVWATWSPASEAANAVIASALKPGTELVSVNVDTDAKKGKDAKKKASLNSNDYYDERGLNSPLALQLKADKVPGVHVIDTKGVYIGRGTPSELAGLLQQAK